MLLGCCQVLYIIANGVPKTVDAVKATKLTTVIFMLQVPNDIKFETVLIDICFHPLNDVIAVGTIDGDIYM